MTGVCFSGLYCSEMFELTKTLGEVHIQEVFMKVA